MNSIALKLRRYRYTLQQWFMTPIHRALGKQIVHLIHPAKTGGTSVKIALMSFGCKTPTHYFCLHGHNFRLFDLHKGDIGIITVRDEEDRRASVLAARKWKAWNYGPIHKWLIGMTKAEEELMRAGYTNAVPSQEWYCIGNRPCKNVLYWLNTATLTQDFEELKPLMDIPDWVKCGHHNKREE